MPRGRSRRRADALLPSPLDKLGTEPVPDDIFWVNGRKLTVIEPPPRLGAPMRCLSGSGGTTQAVKSWERALLRKTKSWKRRRIETCWLA